jgi:hypothetical protein
MRSAVTLDARRLITAISTATIPMPIGITNQGVIVCSFLGIRTPGLVPQNPVAGGRGKERAGQAGRPEGGISLCLLGIPRVRLREALGAAASDCAAVSSPSVGEQLVLGIGRVQTVLAKPAIQLRTGEPESLRGS